MYEINILSRSAAIGLLLMSASIIAQAAGRWVDVRGVVEFAQTPLCALVLANGQDTFSCSGDGRFALEVPLDSKDEITLFVFASGFAPFQQLLSEDEANGVNVVMQRDDSGRSLQVDAMVAAHVAAGQARVSGTVAYSGTPVCALVLANGQRSFSCDDWLGLFSLQAPVDAAEQLTLMIFAAGFQPYRVILDAQTSPLNDTGILTCVDDQRNDLACPVPSHPGQDAEHGRDVYDRDDTDGHAGFRFSKLSGEGDLLPETAQVWDCVRDDVTGLVWETKTDDGGLRDRDDRYSWYDPDPAYNAGDPGLEDDGQGSCLGYDGDDRSRYCNSSAYVARINASGLCGFRDWRMPRTGELVNLLSLDRTAPSIDSTYFPGTAVVPYWSSDSLAGDAYYARFVDFRTGAAGHDYKFVASAIRLVRGVPR